MKDRMVRLTIEDGNTFELSHDVLRMMSLEILMSKTGSQKIVGVEFL